MQMIDVTTGRKQLGQLGQQPLTDPSVMEYSIPTLDNSDPFAVGDGPTSIPSNAWAELDLEGLPFLDSQTPWCSSNPLTVPAVDKDPGTRPFTGTTSLFSDELAIDEVASIRYYLETMLPLDYPFLSSERTQNISDAVLKLLKRSEVCRASVLCQSVLHQQSLLAKFGLRSSSNGKERATSYENLALEGLKIKQNNHSLDLVTYADLEKIEAQFCITQLLLFHVGILHHESLF